jgi:hypothetical protein
VPGGYQAVTLVPGAGTWHVIEPTQNVLREDQAENPGGATCDATPLGKALVVMKCPPLIPNVTRMAFNLSFSVSPGALTTSLMAMINTCDAAGVPDGGNIAWANVRDFVNAGVDENNNPTTAETVKAYNWSYDPRPGDADLDDGSDRWFGVFLSSVGGNSEGFNGALLARSGAIESNYWEAP